MNCKRCGNPIPFEAQKNNPRQWCPDCNGCSECNYERVCREYNQKNNTNLCVGRAIAEGNSVLGDHLMQECT